MRRAGGVHPRHDCARSRVRAEQLVGVGDLLVVERPGDDVRAAVEDDRAAVHVQALSRITAGVLDRHSFERLVPCMSGSSKRTNSIPSELQPYRIFPASVAISWLGRLLSDRCDSFKDWPRRRDEY